MSAYVVNRNHILYLVEASVAWPEAFSPVWIWDVNPETGTYQHETLERLDFKQAVRVAQMLWDENIKSVKARYPGSGDDLPGPIGEDFKITKRDFSKAAFRKFDPVQVLKACDCYVYQSCEHNGWLDSEARAFIDVLIHRTIGHLQGYEDAIWGAPKPMAGVINLSPTLGTDE